MVYNRMKTIWLTVFLILCLVPDMISQDTVRMPGRRARSDFWERVNVGGNLGAQFGRVTVLNIEPRISYDITDHLYAGIGVTYLYYRDKRYAPAISLSYYGGSIFGGYYIWRDLYAHVEYAPLYIPDFYDYFIPPIQGMEDQPPWAHDIYLGGGYRQWIGEKIYVNLMILFNINETIYSPYSNPIIRIGFGAGL